MNACFRYGSSKATYRVDDVVSGRITPTSPLPAAVSPFSWAIAEKLASKDETLSPAGTVALADVEPVEVPHAAMMMAKAPVPAIKVNDLSFRN